MAEYTSRTVRITPRLVLGAAILFVGLALTLDNLGVVDADYLLDFWPLALVAIGLSKLAGGRRGSWLGGSLWILVGVWWTAYNLDAVDIHPIDLWPLLLIFAGFMLVRRALFPSHRTARISVETGEGGEGGERESMWISDEGGDADRVSGVACLSGVRRQSSSQHFRGGEFTACMGGCEVDLREADIRDEPAVIDVFAFWGGIDVRVPTAWTVKSEVSAILGGFSDRTRGSSADPDKLLVVRGMVMMGGVEIKN